MYDKGDRVFIVSYKSFSCYYFINETISSYFSDLSLSIRYNALVTNLTVRIVTHLVNQLKLKNQKPRRNKSAFIAEVPPGLFSLRAAS